MYRQELIGNGEKS